MQPIGPLMHEHRLIERLVRLIVKEAAAIESGQRPDHRFIDNAVDFFKYFADRCHHGKEEEILFKELAAKPLSDDERRILQELIEEHVVGRKMVQALRTANQEAAACEDPAPAGRVVTLLKELADFYPKHIEEGGQALLPSRDAPLLPRGDGQDARRLRGHRKGCSARKVHGHRRGKEKSLT